MTDGESIGGDGRTLLPWLACFLLTLLTVRDAHPGEDAAAIEPIVEEAPWTLDDAYYQLMLAWARGSETAVAELSGLQQRLAEQEAGFEIDLDTMRRLPASPRVKRRSTATGRKLPGLACLRKIQHFAHTRIAGVDPEAILPLADLNRRLYAEQMQPGALRPWLAEHSEERTFWLTAFYLEVAESDARAQAAGMLIAMADALTATAIEEAVFKARKVFGRALELDPGNLAARYWAAFLAERTGHYRDAVKHLRVLVESPRKQADATTSTPDDVEAALRLAINHARTGRQDAADAALQSIAQGEGADWLRILAYQQLGQLHAGKRPRRAASLLREGSRRFPDNARLRLQLSHQLRADWDTALSEVRRVEADWRGDPGVSPRVRYCRPRRDGIDAELARIEQEVERRKEALARGLERLLAPPRRQSPRFDDCPEGLPP